MENTGRIQASKAIRGQSVLAAQVTGWPDAAGLTARVLLIVGTLALAADPAAWLLRSWTDPGYGSYGWAVFALSLALFARSWSSPLMETVPIPRSPFLLLIGTAAIRGVGQVLDIDTISALALGVDVYALARLARLDRRAWAVSPVGLAALFLCSLPIQRLIERSIGQGLQDLSASGACFVLGLFTDDISCQGVRIVLSGKAVMVDLPCAGIGGLTLMGTALILIATVVRPGLRTMILAAAVALIATLAANILRVTILSAGAAYAPFDILAEPFHSAIGLVTLALAALPSIAIMTRPATGAPPPKHRAAPKRRRALSLPLAIFFVAATIVVLALPSRPLDASATQLTVALPTQIDGYRLLDQPLSGVEKAYFATYGGGAAKGLYGPLGLLVSRTASPLRHLHDPRDCLRGLGYTVTFVGTAATPASIYRLVGPDGRNWTARVTYTADDGTTVPTVSAAIWHWFANPDTTWTMIQRITPAALPEHERARLDANLLAALDLPSAQDPN